MKPFDPRLVRYAAAAKVQLLAGAGLGLAQVACAVAFAWLLTAGIVGVVQGTIGADLALILLSLVGVVLVRSAVEWALEYVSARAAVVVKQQLRGTAMAAVTQLGPGWLASRNSTDLTTLLVRGIDALDDYFSRYVPQLILTAIAMPLLLLAIFVQDWESAVTIALTLPLIPLFMILIGWATQRTQRRQWETLRWLSSYFLDIISGLTTITIFGRTKRQRANLREVGERYRSETMKVLRMSFLSGFALELCASLSVALVAVQIGTRLIEGEMTLQTGLCALLLTPLVYAPLRQVGAQFHAAAEGVTASQDIFEILEAAAPRPAATAAAPGVVPGSVSAPAAASASAPAPVDPSAPSASAPAPVDPSAPSPDRELHHSGSGLSRPAELVFRDVHLNYEGLLVLDGLEARFGAGALTALTGPSGVGKSSLFAAALGFVGYSGAVTVGGEDLASLDTEARLARFAWAGQHPRLFEGSVADNIRIGSEVAARPDNDANLADAMRLAGIASLDPERELDALGAGLSGGQSQRVCLARAYYRALSLSCPVLLLDEPTSALDDHSEEIVVAGFLELADRGYAVVVASHRPVVRAAASRTVELREVASV